MLKFKYLTSKQKRKICNGCGAKGGWVKPPNFIFKASCNHHDFLYWKGCSEEDRLRADNAFYKYMKIDICSAKWHKRYYYRIWAYAYYKAVRLFGNKHFHYASRQRTQKDLRSM